MPGGATVAGLLRGKRIKTSVSCFDVSYQLAEAICKERIKLFHVQPLFPRLSPHLFWRKQPTANAAKRFIQGEAKADSIVDSPEPRTQALVQCGTLALPKGVGEFQQRRKFGGGYEPAFDAVRSLKLLEFTHFLKDKNKSAEAMDACIDAAFDGDDEGADGLRSRQTANPKHSSIYAQILKVDAVGMIVERREWLDIYANSPEKLVSAHLFTDGSPVTGQELQGMILQLCWLDGSITERIMPGIALHYGGASLCDKVFAFIWALWLVAGPNGFIMRFILDRIFSVTTDMGTELGFIGVLDLLNAFILRPKTKIPIDQLAGYIVPGSRLVKNALKIPDWSHIFGNLMKYSVNKIENWATVLISIRYLCRFFRIYDWRQQIIVKLQTNYPEVKQLLKYFTAKLAKWRYETLSEVLRQLLLLRFWCETYLSEIDEWFPAFEDQDLLQGVKHACGWTEFWILLSCLYTLLIMKLEEGRRWGLRCPCCEQLRREDGIRRPKCPRASRRLHQARVFIARLVEELATTGRNLSLASCGDCVLGLPTDDLLDSKMCGRTSA